MTDDTKQRLQALVDFVFALWPRRAAPATIYQQAQVVAHRGVHDNLLVAENTLEAFRLAANLKVWAIELDVRWTRDLIPVVIHDATALRVFGIPLTVSKLTFAELRQKLPRVPSLEEVIAEFGGKLHMMVEIKSEPFPALAQQKEILRRVLSPLRPGEDFHILTLYPQIIESFDLFPPHTYVLVAETNSETLLKVVLNKRYGGLAGHYALFSDSIVAELKKNGLKSGTGFIASGNVLNRELSRGIEWIFTNHPAFVVRQIARGAQLADTLTKQETPEVP